MSRARDLADLLDANGDVDAGALDNVPAADVVNDTTPELGGDLQSNGNDVVFADNDKAIFGAGSDLQIYHDGLNSYISDQGTGNLRILAQDFRVVNSANSETMIQANVDADVRLYYDSSQKLATTATGVSVTGTVTATAFSGDGSGLTGLSGGAVGLTDVGSFILARVDSGVGIGSTVGGSSLTYANANGGGSAAKPNTGTWRAHGYVTTSNIEQKTIVWQRIS